MTCVEFMMMMWSYTHLSAAELHQGETLARSRQEHVAVLEATVGASSAPAEPPHWRSLAMTEVVYRQDDLLSKFFGISSIGPVALMVLLAGLASARCGERRTAAVNLILYLILSFCVNVALKAFIRSPRPAHPAAGINYTTMNGMPSDHAQFMAGFSVYLLRRWRHTLQQNAGKGRNGHLRQSKSTSAGVARMKTPPPYALILLLLCGSFFIGAGRVYNGYHTVGQVLLGWVVGIALALVCTTARVQYVFTWVSEKVLVPCMLVCTFWTQAIC